MTEQDFLKLIEKDETHWSYLICVCVKSLCMLVWRLVYQFTQIFGDTQTQKENIFLNRHKNTKQKKIRFSTRNNTQHKRANVSSSVVFHPFLTKSGTSEETPGGGVWSSQCRCPSVGPRQWRATLTGS